MQAKKEVWLVYRHIKQIEQLRQKYYRKFIYLFFWFLIYFLDRRKGKEKERVRNINVWLPLMGPYWGPGPQPRHVCALTENWTGDPLVRRPALNPLSHITQGLPVSLNQASLSLPPSLPPSLSLSLSHTHTHTHSTAKSMLTGPRKSRTDRFMDPGTAAVYYQM